MQRCLDASEQENIHCGGELFFLVLCCLSWRLASFLVFAFVGERLHDDDDVCAVCLLRGSDGHLMVFALIFLFSMCLQAFVAYATRVASLRGLALHVPCSMDELHCA